MDMMIKTFTDMTDLLNAAVQHLMNAEENSSPYFVGIYENKTLIYNPAMRVIVLKRVIKDQKALEKIIRKSRH